MLREGYSLHTGNDDSYKDSPEDSMLAQEQTQKCHKNIWAGYQSKQKRKTLEEQFCRVKKQLLLKVDNFIKRELNQTILGIPCSPRYLEVPPSTLRHFPHYCHQIHKSKPDTLHQTKLQVGNNNNVL